MKTSKPYFKKSANTPESTIVESAITKSNYTESARVDSAPILMGRVQNLRIMRFSKNGAYLSKVSPQDSQPTTAHNANNAKSPSLVVPKEVLLPNKFLTPQNAIGDVLKVFVLTDSQDRPVATTQEPKAQYGDIALLDVVSCSPFGCFLDLGVDKHIFMPCKNPQNFMPNQKVLVAITLDKQSRLIAKQGVKKFLKPTPRFNQALSKTPLQAYIFEKTPLGFGCVVENAYFGLLYANELPASFAPELHTPIKVYAKGTNQGRFDLTLYPPLQKNHKQILLDSMPLGLSFSTSPESIFESFHISKKLFKRLINELVREGKIYFEKKEQSFKLTQKEKA